MGFTNKYELSLGLEPYDVLGFESEDKLNKELLKLIEPRPEFKKEFQTWQKKSVIA